MRARRLPSPWICQPSFCVSTKAHACSLPPPSVDFARLCNPYAPLVSKLTEISQESFVRLPFPAADDVVGMDDEAHQAVIFHDEFRLPLPQVNRVVSQDVKQRIVLRRGDREFQQLPDEIRHYGAAATALGIEVRDVGHRHFIREIKIVEPFFAAIENRGAKSFRAPLSAILINFGHSAKKLLTVAVKVSVMIQILNRNPQNRAW